VSHGPKQTRAALKRRRDRARDEDFQPVTCLVEACKQGVFQRGLCDKHRQEVGRMIRSGKVTERELVDAGLMAPVKSASTMHNRSQR